MSDEEAAVEADTVIVSSLTDKAHGYPGLVRGDPRVINALEVAEQGLDVAIDGRPLVTLAAVESADHESGNPKDNALYAVEVGGLWILHTGDLGYGLTPDELAPFVDRCDVLLTLAGQTNTLAFEDLDVFIDHLKPR